MGKIALCWTAEGLSKPVLEQNGTIAVDSSQKFLFKFHGFEGGVYFELLWGLNLDVGLVL